MKKSSKLIWTGLLTALASSLCCIAPLLALIAGGTGMASSFSWLTPARPYLIGLTVLVLGYAWLKKLRLLKPTISDTEVDNCGCEVENGKTSFMQTKLFLGIVTIFAILVTAFPYFSEIFYPDNKKDIVVVDNNNVHKIVIEIEGMTCDACEQHVDHAVNELSGIVGVTTSYAKGNSIVSFDITKTSTEEIETAVNSTGYTIINIDIE